MLPLSCCSKNKWQQRERDCSNRMSYVAADIFFTVCSSINSSSRDRPTDYRWHDRETLGDSYLYAPWRESP